MYPSWDVCSPLNVCINHSHLSTIVWRKINKYENDNENFPQYYEVCERKHFFAGRVNVDSDAESVCIAWMWGCVRVASKRNNSNTNSASNWGVWLCFLGNWEELKQPKSSGADILLWSFHEICDVTRSVIDQCKWNSRIVKVFPTTLTDGTVFQLFQVFNTI